jgi:hypothetical protein
MNPKNTALSALRHHVTGAIARGEKQAIAGIPAQAMSAQHTPGPYYVARTAGHQGLIISEATGTNIAVVYDKKDSPLLAAAPELLEALKKCVTCMESEYLSRNDPLDLTLPEGLKEARAALAKATEGQQ